MDMDFEDGTRRDSSTDLILGFGYTKAVPKSEPNPQPSDLTGLTLGLSVARHELSSSPNSEMSTSVKVENNDTVSDHEEAAERISSKVSDEDNDEEGISGRKKLRLTKEQSALLEDKFREHTTLNPKQKQALAKQLGLRPRQVEVWFQNRRARTKLKQTEMDCQVLKKWCERLSNENRRLHKELQELMKSASTPPMYMHIKTSRTLCPSCSREISRHQKLN